MRPGPKAGMAPRGLLHGVGGLGCARGNRSQLSGATVTARACQALVVDLLVEFSATKTRTIHVEIDGIKRPDGQTARWSPPH